MRLQRHAIKIGIGVFFLIFLSVIAIVGAFWETLPTKERAIVAISGVGALGTAALALATFWTLKQNDQTLKDLKKERQKPVILDLLAEVIDPIIEQSRNDVKKLSGSEDIWSIISHKDELGSVNITNPLSNRYVDESVLSEFKKNHSDLYYQCRKWSNLVNELDEAAEELAESVYKADEYDTESLFKPDEYTGVSVQHKAVRAVLNVRRTSEGVEEYRFTMYRKYSEKCHQYWRAQWNLLKLSRKIHTDTTEMKRELKKEYGISNGEITEQQESR